MVVVTLTHQPRTRVILRSYSRLACEIQCCNLLKRFYITLAKDVVSDFEYSRGASKFLREDDVVVSVLFLVSADSDR